MISSFMDIFCPDVIRIDESVNNHYFQNDRSVLNMWSQSSQKLGLEINGYGFRSLCSSHLEHSSPRRGIIVGVGFLRCSPSRTKGFFEHLSLGRSMVMGVNFFGCLSPRNYNLVVKLQACLSPGRGAFVTNKCMSPRRVASLASNMSPRKRHHEEKVNH
jgi:hypothetical protein